MASDSQSSTEETFGVVTFLDVLGWKGIYHRKDNPLSDLDNITKELKNIRNRLMGASTESLTPQEHITNTEVKCISDTFVIHTKLTKPADLNRAVDLHGVYCKEALNIGLKGGLFLRGATSCGDFTASEDSFVGKAIDEAAAWHEYTDWIGVHLTPSAWLKYKPPQDSLWVAYSHVPFKGSYKGETLCLNWFGGISEDDLKNKIYEQAPLVPEIASKYMNTLKFYKKLQARAKPEPE